MTNQRTMHFSVQSVGDAVRHLAQFIAQPSVRIFGPTNDDYPEVGLQPYKGDLADKDDR